MAIGIKYSRSFDLEILNPKMLFLSTWFNLKGLKLPLNMGWDIEGKWMKFSNYRFLVCWSWIPSPSLLKISTTPLNQETDYTQSLNT